ncbi:MAG: hypothetical protein HW416_3336 [Chloroflexi bacterium]|nr:hypothetical protein [Chloroflexota bacterium]
MKVVLVLVVVLMAAVVAAGAAVVVGAAPRCSTEPGTARSAQEIGDVLDEDGVVVVTDAEASSIARRYVGGVVEDGRVCFTPGAAHASGKLPLGPVTPSFYATLGVDLTGPVPSVTDLDVTLGALPSLPGLSAPIKQAVADLVNQNLARWQLEQEYAADFTAGSVAVKKVP